MGVDRIVSKGLVVGIIAILVGVSVLSSVSSKDISSSMGRILEDNAEIALWDNNKEIITHITGYVWFEDIIWSGNGLISQLELWDRGYEDTNIRIIGFKKPLYPLYESYFKTNPSHIIASRFFGLSFPYEEFYVYIRGFAFGNIEWE